VFTFGSARFVGSMATARLNSPVVRIARTSSGDGYWLVAGDGGIFTFGDAQFRGPAAAELPPVPTPAPMPSGAGNVTVSSSGMDPARPTLGPVLVDYLERMASAASREIVVSTGTRHSRLATSGRVSDHCDLHDRGAHRQRLETSAAASEPRLCPDLVFRKQSDDLFYDVRTRRISCRSRYRTHNKRCISGWRCAYGVEPKWAVEPRIRLSRKRQQIYFGIPGRNGHVVVE
jgi:hypothetical protein